PPGTETLGVGHPESKADRASWPDPRLARQTLAHRIFPVQRHQPGLDELEFDIERIELSGEQPEHALTPARSPPPHAPVAAARPLSLGLLSRSHQTPQHSPGLY